MIVWDLEHRNICSGDCAIVLVLDYHSCHSAFCKHYTDTLEEVGAALQNLEPGNVRLMEIGVFIL